MLRIFIFGSFLGLVCTSALETPAMLQISKVYSELRVQAVDGSCKPGTETRACVFVDETKCRATIGDINDLCQSEDLRQRKSSLIREDELKDLTTPVIDCLNAKLPAVVNKAVALDPKATSCLVRGRTDGTKFTFRQRYLGLVKAESENMNLLKSRVKAHDRTLCPGYQSPDMSGCFKAYVSKMNFETASEPILLMIVGVLAAETDRPAYGQKAASMFIIDSTLVICEHLDPSQFFVASSSSVSPGDKADFAEIKAAENENLKEFKSKTLGLLEQSFASLSKIPPSSLKATADWEARKTADLQKRFENIKAKTWRLP